MALFLTSRLFGILTFYVVVLVTCERSKEKMYEDVNGAFCFKRLNGTNEFGCTSSRSGDIGVLHVLSNLSDLSWLLNNATAAPYVVMLPFHFPDFTDTIMKLKESGKVSGLIITSNRTSYSPDDVCPNRYSGLLSHTCSHHSPWNPIGSSLLFVNFGFPIMYIDGDEHPKSIDSLNKCFTKHNAHDIEEQSSRSLCAVELSSHMLAAVDSNTCIRRSTMINNLTPMRYCDPLLGLNIHLPLFPRTMNKNSSKENRSVILLVTRLDGVSMFDGLVPGAVSPILGIISLLAIAQTLKHLTKGSHNPEKNVMFVFFHGESYDYIGSSRMIYDMENNAFPYRLQPDIKEQNILLKLEDIGLVIELDQVMKREIFYHSIHKIKEESLISKFIAELKKELNKLSFKLSGITGRLPPASLQRFLKKDSLIEGVVLSSYSSTYDNAFYHSIFDTGKALNFTYLNKTEPKGETIQEYVAGFSLAIARSLYILLFNSSAEIKQKLDHKLIHLVDELMYCYMENPSCEMFENVTFRKPLDKKPYPVYIGVIRNNNVTTLTGLTLAWLTGDKIERNRSSCHNVDTDLTRQYFWMVGDNEDGICIESFMNYSLAQSPAFEIKEYNWSSHEYSTWTESVWQEKMSARIFIKPSKKQEILTLSVGLLSFVISFVVVYFINTKANILFHQQILSNGGC